MNLSLIGKIGVLFKYIFSSFLAIEMFIISLLLFFILLFNLRKNNKIVQIIAIGIYIGFLIGIMISYGDYAKLCLDSFIKAIMNYIYFPSTIAYFFIIIFVTAMILRTVFSTKMTTFKKGVNYFFFSILYFLFMSFMALASYSGVDLINVVDLYKNETILAIVQVSNMLLLFWFIFTLFYELYKYFKKNFD